MERLTARDKSGYAYYPKCFEHPCEGERSCCTYTAKMNCKFEEKVSETLAYYEDLAEQGRLVELPCKLGDTIYQLRTKRHVKGEGISPRIVGYVTILGNGKYEINHQGMTPCRESDLGKTWFLTKEEAEARLAELEENDE